MSELETRLAGFRRRVRLLQGWRGVARGGLYGGLIALVLAALDFFHVWYTSWWGVGVPIIGGMLLGLAYGLTRPISMAALADSIDRRGQLQNRIATAAEDHHEAFAEDQRADALQRLSKLDPNRVYPVKVTRWHTGSLAMSLLASVIVLLGNTPILLTPQQRADQKKLEEVGTTIERVAKPVAEKKPEESTKQAKELAQKYESFADELKRGRMPMEKAMEEANKLAAEAERASQEQMERSEKALSKIQDAMMRESFDAAMKEMGMDPSDLGDMSPERMEQLSQMSEQDLANMEAALNQQMANLQRQINEGKNDKGEALSQSELDALKDQLEAAKKQAQEIKLSKKAQEFMKRLTSHPKYKELMELAKELAKANQRAAENPNQPSLTQEQIDEINRKLEELADQLKDDKDLEAFLENLKASLKECEGQCDSAGLGLGLLALLPSWGPSGPGQDNFFRDIGQVPQSENEQDIKAASDVRGVRGQRQDKGDETYMEIKGPASLGERSKTPYFKVMPKYRKQAEEAMNKDRIPKEHQKRVRDYFDSLNRGKS